ncbi:MAG: hypothetical protein ACI4N3_05035 [Alphaproteobacteria bacterium]
MRRNSKIKRYITYFLVLFMLQGCKDNSTKDFLNTVKNSTSLTIEEIINYNYKEFFHSLKNAYITSKRNRYPQNQEIVISTNRDGQLYAFNGIINECEIIQCNIKESILKRNTIFPENTTAYFLIEIPTSSSQQFIDAISKYGKITHNKSNNDNYIIKDLEYYNNLLTSLNIAKEELEQTLSKKEVFNASEIEKLTNNAISINNKILYTQSDIKYLTDTLDKKLISINIQKEYNSTSNKVKTNLQNIIYFASDYLHYFIIIIFIIAFIWILRLIKLLITKSFNSVKNKKKYTPPKINEPHF